MLLGQIYLMCEQGSGSLNLVLKLGFVRPLDNSIKRHSINDVHSSYWATSTNQIKNKKELGFRFFLVFFVSESLINTKVV